MTVSAEEKQAVMAMPFRHSRGPWRLDPILSGSENDKGWRIYDTDGHFVAEVSPRIDNDRGDASAEGQGNASLLLFAPALLAALHEATTALSGGLWDYGPEQDEHKRCDEVIERCEAVLAKATGR